MEFTNCPQNRSLLSFSSVILIVWEVPPHGSASKEYRQEQRLDNFATKSNIVLIYAAYQTHLLCYKMLHTESIIQCMEWQLIAIQLNNTIFTQNIAYNAAHLRCNKILFIIITPLTGEIQSWDMRYWIRASVPPHPCRQRRWSAHACAIGAVTTAYQYNDSIKS